MKNNAANITTISDNSKYIENYYAVTSFCPYSGSAIIEKNAN